jgi:hypothetical protein
MSAPLISREDLEALHTRERQTGLSYWGERDEEEKTGMTWEERTLAEMKEAQDMKDLAAYETFTALLDEDTYEIYQEGGVCSRCYDSWHHGVTFGPSIRANICSACLEAAIPEHQAFLCDDGKYIEWLKHLQTHRVIRELGTKAKVQELFRHAYTMDQVTKARLFAKYLEQLDTDRLARIKEMLHSNVTAVTYGTVALHAFTKRAPAMKA